MSPRSGEGRRLALVHYTAAPVIGGVESIMAAHASVLRAAGHDVLVIAGQGDGLLVPEIDSRHPDVEQLTRRLAAGDPAARLFGSLRARLVRQLRPLLADRDVVIAHNVLTMPFNLPLAAAIVDTARCVVAWTHDLAWINPRYAAFRHARWPWSLLREPQPGVRYVAPSQARRREITRTLGLHPSGVVVVPNGVDPAGFWRLSQRTRELLGAAGLEDADPFILVPVRVTRHKRLELAVEAAARLHRLHPGLKLVVSGPLGRHSSDNLEYAAALCRQRSRLGLDGVVHYLYELAQPGGEHPVDAQLITELYQVADVVLLSSSSEGFGLPVLEAALSRAPLVCPDIPALTEVAGREVWTFPSGGDVDRVVDASLRALNSPAARLRRRALRDYTWSAIQEMIGPILDQSRTSLAQ